MNLTRVLKDEGLDFSLKESDLKFLQESIVPEKTGMEEQENVVKEAGYFLKKCSSGMRCSDYCDT